MPKPTVNDTSPAPSPCPSPCINVCVMDTSTGWCTGCFRTITEIVGWGNAPSAAKWAVLHALEAREKTYFEGCP